MTETEEEPVMMWVSLGFGLLSAVSVLLLWVIPTRDLGAMAGGAMVVLFAGIVAVVLGLLAIRRGGAGRERAIAVAGIVFGAIPALLAAFFLAAASEGL